MPECLAHREVGVGELHVLTDHPDPDGLRRGVGPLDERLPVRQVGRARLHPEVVENLVVEPLGAEVEGNLVDRVDVARRDDRLNRQVGEEADLLPDVARQRALRAADQEVGLDADAAQLLNRVLGGLGLELARVPQERDQREVDEHRPVAALVDLELAQRLEERERLDVADRTPDLGDHEVDLLRLGHEPDALLDLVGDVRDHLHGAAEVVAAPLAANHGVVDGAGGDVRPAGGVGVGEALVMAEVEVSLGAVLGDEDLAVLERAHRARVDVDVRVELLERDREVPGHEQPSDRRRRDPLAKRGHHAPGDEDEACLPARHATCRASLASAAPASDRRAP